MLIRQENKLSVSSRSMLYCNETEINEQELLSMKNGKISKIAGKSFLMIMMVLMLLFIISSESEAGMKGSNYVLRI